MTDQDILSIFTRLLRDVLGDESIELTMETKREDVPQWDSFNYVTFIAVAETQLGIRFSVGDVESFGTVGAIVSRTRKLLG
jgi:acyl carrier protein